MAVIVHKEQERDTELNRRISADLRERAQRSSGVSDPDLVEDSDYTVELRETSRFGWVWMVLIGLAVISLISIVLL